MIRNQRLYQFVVTDDQARWGAAIRSMWIAISLGLLLSVLGLKDRSANIATALAAVVSMSVFAIRYATSGALETNKPGNTETKRRTVLRLLGVGVFEWISDISFGNANWALSVAGQALGQVRKDGSSISFPKIVYAKSILDSRRNGVSVETRRHFRSAYAALDIAQVYADIRQSKPEKVTQFSPNAKTTQWIVGASAGGSELFYTGSPKGTDFIANGNVAFESLTIDAVVASSELVGLIRISPGAKVLFKNCIIRHHAQNLAGIALVDVLFEECLLEIKSTDRLALTGVSFKNCHIDCDDVMAHQFPGLAQGNATSITYATWPSV